MIDSNKYGLSKLPRWFVTIMGLFFLFVMLLACVTSVENAKADTKNVVLVESGQYRGSLYGEGLDIEISSVDEDGFNEIKGTLNFLSEDFEVEGYINSSDKYLYLEFVDYTFLERQFEIMGDDSLVFYAYGDKVTLYKYSD